MKTGIEPYRVKVVEPIRMSTPQERAAMLHTAGYNLFKLDSADVIIDLLTDSGTSAMSAAQWGAIMQADESYAGASSYARFEHAVKDLFGFPFVLPVHQGRAGERILFETLVTAGDIIPSNTHFDTTRANIERLGAVAVDLPSPLDGDSKFKGNLDLCALERLLREKGDSVPFGMLTITNNGLAGQPVSMENIIATSDLLTRYGKPLFIDAARCVENAFLITRYERGFSTTPVKEVLSLLMKYAHGCLMSAKKDAIANMGGFVALRDRELFERIKLNCIVTEGYPTYGGLSGRDLEAIAVGLREVTSVDYLSHRWETATRLANSLAAAGVPVVTPPAMHAIYLDAGAFLGHLAPAELPGQALACELYLEAGVRSCEIGTVMFGACRPKKSKELLRLALPRRVYSASHYEYVAEAIINVFLRREAISGMRIVENADVPLRHFTAGFEWLPRRNSMPVQNMVSESPQSMAKLK
jgi:tryptophanase